MMTDGLISFFYFVSYKLISRRLKAELHNVNNCAQMFFPA